MGGVKPDPAYHCRVDSVFEIYGISYETYNEGGHLIEFWLKPAVVALGVPLYLQLEMIKKQLLPIVISQLAGCLVGLVAVVVIAKFAGCHSGDYLFIGS